MRRLLIWAAVLVLASQAATAATLDRLYRTGRVDDLMARTFGEAPADDLQKR
jgi:hypothetical protein